MVNRAESIIPKTIQNGIRGLSFVLSSFVRNEMELERVSRVAVLSMKSGLGTNSPVFQKIAQICIAQQKTDGGWVDVEDSVWNTAFLKEYGSFSKEYTGGLDWLKQQQLEDGSWGRSRRDKGRIPITGNLLFLLPGLSSKKSLLWLENAWRKDFLTNPKLTYKAAFFLMAIQLDYQSANETLLVDTVAWLASQQNKDLGWGPWKGHPVGSSPFCTGIALTGLLQYPDRVEKSIVEKGLKWLEKNQQENGLWPDHYIDEGSAWSFYALTRGCKFLKEQR